MIRKAITTLIDLISILIIICAVIILISVVFTKSGDVPKIKGYSLMCVVTGSMEPTIPTNSLIIVKEKDTDKIKVDDIISFHSQDPSLEGTINTHRVVKIHKEAGKRIFETKGDANNVVDLYPANEDDVIGEVVFVSPYAGILVRLSSNPVIFIPLILIPLALLIIINARHTFKVARRLEDEEREEAVKELMDKLRKEKENKDSE